MDINSFLDSGMWRLITMLGGVFGWVAGIVFGLLAWSLKRTFNALDRGMAENRTKIDNLYTAMGAQNEDNSKRYFVKEDFERFVVPLIQAQIAPLARAVSDTNVSFNMLTGRIDRLLDHQRRD